MKLAAQSTLSRWPSISCHLEEVNLANEAFSHSAQSKCTSKHKKFKQQTLPFCLE